MGRELEALGFMVRSQAERHKVPEGGTPYPDRTMDWGRLGTATFYITT